MAYAEAIAYGLPVVGCHGGAVSETVPAAAGVLVAPRDVEALASVLRALIEDPAKRARLADGARSRGGKPPRPGPGRPGCFRKSWRRCGRFPRNGWRYASLMTSRRATRRCWKRLQPTSVTIPRCRWSISLAAPDRPCGHSMNICRARQDWRLVDNNLSLLARASTLGAGPPTLTVNARPVDLARDLEAAIDGPLQLVTTSALLDLVLDEWLERLAVEDGGAAAAAVRGADLQRPGVAHPQRTHSTQISSLPLIATSVATRGLARPSAPKRRQGPRRPSRALDITSSRARRTGFLNRDRDIQLQMLAGWALAPGELDDVPRLDIAAWLQRRQDRAEHGRTSMRIGHVDLFATPMATR